MLSRSLTIVTPLLLCLPLSAQRIITTLAGGASADGRSATSVSFVVPHVAVDPSGNVYVSDLNEARVYEIASNGTLTLRAGNGSQGYAGDNGAAVAASFNTPSGIAVDAAGNLYISDAGNNRIRKVSNGVVTTIAGTGIPGFSGDNGPANAAQIDGPAGLAVLANGDIYFADAYNHRVRKVSGGTITTVAGDGNATYGGDGGAAIAASLYSPSAVALDSSGNLYIADAGNNRIRKVSGGVITAVAGNGTHGFSGDGGAAVNAALNDPTGIAVDGAGNLYIADQGNFRIRKVTGAVISTIAGTGASGFAGDGGPSSSATINAPQGVAVDAAGNIFVEDTGNNRIRKITGGVIATVAGGGASGDGGAPTNALVDDPSGIAIDSAGNIYVAEIRSSRIRKISGGVISTIAGNGTQDFGGDNGPAVNSVLNYPEGLAIDAAGNIYVADTYNHRIRKIANGVITTVAGNGDEDYSGDNVPATSASLEYPSGMAFDVQGNLYIADSGNNRIRKVTNGIITTVVGNGTAGFAGDGGPATAAELNLPQSLHFDANGNMFILDAGNNAVRKVSNGVISTVAGNGTAGYTGDLGPAVNASLNAPEDMTLDSSGNLYILDSSNQVIREVTNGFISTIAGSGAAGYGGDGGPAPAALLNFPYGVAVDSSGRVLFTDSHNNRVRQLSAWAPVNVTFATNPPGLQVQLGDNPPQVNPTITVDQGAVLNFSAVTPQPDSGGAAGKRYVFRSWSNGSSNATQTGLYPPAGGGTFTATFDVQYQVVATSTIGGTVMQTPAAADNYYAGNSTVQITAAAAPNYVFTGFSGDVVSSTNPLSVMVAGKAVHIRANFALSSLSLGQNSAQFGATAGGGLVTDPQIINVQAPPGAVWTVSKNQNFISVSPTSGTGSGSFTIGIIPMALPASGTLSGIVTVTAAGVPNSPQTVNVGVTIQAPAGPYGSFDTPVDGTTGVAGAIAVTGWALDNIEVAKVDVWREKIDSEPVAANGLVYIGDAVFVAGARPDVASTHPSAPQNNRAGWGYLMLTNGLGGSGNGAFKIHAIAHNSAGLSQDLGTKTITVDNAHASRPFGTIDTPAQGGTMSGTYTNFGWALTQQPYAIPVDGSTITVTVDGMPLGHPVYGQYRPDIANAFPGLANSDGAIGYYFIDTTQFANGVHTLAWLVYDNAGRGDGIGSRFVNIANSGTGTIAQPAIRPAELSRANRSIEVEELERIELPLDAAAGYSIVDGQRRPLPAGSTLSGGVFYWQLAPAFSGSYTLLFQRPDGSELQLRVAVHPKTFDVRMP